MLMMKDMGEKARVSRDNNAMALFRNAFTTTLTSDAVALFSNSHTTLGGDTVDNLETGGLTLNNLETMITSLAVQKDQAGVIRGHMPHVLLVPPELFREATEMTESKLISDSADNAVNWLSTKYGLKVKTSPYLGSAAGGSATAFFLLAKNHDIRRYKRQALTTELVDWKYQRNDNYIFKANFREILGAISYSGAVGNSG